MRKKTRLYVSPSLPQNILLSSCSTMLQIINSIKFSFNLHEENYIYALKSWISMTITEFQVASWIMLKIEDDLMHGKKINFMKWIPHFTKTSSKMNIEQCPKLQLKKKHTTRCLFNVLVESACCQNFMQSFLPIIWLTAEMDYTFKTKPKRFGPRELRHMEWKDQST